MTQSPIPQPLADAIEVLGTSRDVIIGCKVTIDMLCRDTGRPISTTENTINSALANITTTLAALEAFAEKEEGMTLPELPENSIIHDLMNTQEGHWVCVLTSKYPHMTHRAVDGEGSTPRAAVLAAIAQIPKQDGEPK